MQTGSVYDYDADSSMGRTKAEWATGIGTRMGTPDHTFSAEDRDSGLKQSVCEGYSTVTDLARLRG